MTRKNPLSHPQGCIPVKLVELRQVRVRPSGHHPGGRPVTPSPTLLEALDLVPDPRSRHGRIHPLVAVLGLTAVGLLAGCKALDAVVKFGRDHGLSLAAAFGFHPAKTPNKSALGKIFRRLDPSAVETALRTWLEGREATGEYVALYGKTLAGSRRGDFPGQHLIAAFAIDHAVVVGQPEMARTTNEHKAALRLLGVLLLAGRIITRDVSLGRTRAGCEQGRCRRHWRRCGTRRCTY